MLTLQGLPDSGTQSVSNAIFASFRPTKQIFDYLEDNKNMVTHSYGQIFSIINYKYSKKSQFCSIFLFDLIELW